MQTVAQEESRWEGTHQTGYYGETGSSYTGSTIYFFRHHSEIKLMIIITNKEKIPKNPWSRHGISDAKWQILYIVAQAVMAVGVVLQLIGMFLEEDKQFVKDLGTFLLLLGVLPLIAGHKSEKEDEYDRIFRRGMFIFCALGVITLSVMYIITLIW